MAGFNWRAQVAATPWDVVEADIVAAVPQHMTTSVVRRIHELRARGGTYRQIGKAVGWSWQYVAQICQQTKGVLAKRAA